MSTSLGSRRRLSERRLRLVGDVTERLRILDGEIGAHLAVELDLRLPQPRDEMVVRQAVRARYRVDAHDPEPPERPFLVLAVAVGVRDLMVYLILRVAL